MATLTTTELAERLGTDPRTLRRFLRAQDLGVGQGRRYALPGTKANLGRLQKQFDRWASHSES